MDIHRSQREHLYHEQCIQLRRTVREADLRAAQGHAETSCVFLVLGPRAAGKSSLLQ
jgi:phage/plasmid-associated DNA primase